MPKLKPCKNRLGEWSRHLYKGNDRCVRCDAPRGGTNPTPLQRAYDVRKKLADGGDLNNFALIAKFPSDDQLFLDRPCYAALSRVGGPRGKVLYFVDHVWAGVRRDLTKGEIEYFNWLVNDSHCADMMLIKDVEDWHKWGMVFEVKEHSAPFVIWAAHNLRYVREFPSIVQRWCVLKEHIEPHVALGMAHCFVINKDTFYVNMCYGGHQWLQKSYFDKELFIGLATNRKQPGTPMHKSTRFGGWLMAKQWGPKGSYIFGQSQWKPDRSLATKTRTDSWGTPISTFGIEHLPTIVEDFKSYHHLKGLYDE